MPSILFTALLISCIPSLILAEVVSLDRRLDDGVDSVDSQLTSEFGKNKIAYTPMPGEIRSVKTSEESTFDAWVDEENWILILNYNRGGADSTQLDENTLPLDPVHGYSHRYPSTLGLNAGDITEIRFYCRSSAHTRTLHFRTSNNRIINALMTGNTVGGESLSGDDWANDKGFIPMDRHDAFLPKSATDSGTTNLMTSHMFYTPALYHWNIRTFDKPANDFRFECDSRAKGSEHATIHQVWIRVKKDMISPPSMITEGVKRAFYIVGMLMSGLTGMAVCWFVWLRRYGAPVEKTKV